MSKRGHGEGTIIADNERGGFRAALSLGSINGKRRRKVIRGATRKEVSDRLDEARSELKEERELGLRPDLDKQTVGQYLHYWLEEVIRPKCAQKTFLSYLAQVERHILPDLGKLRLRSLRPQHVRALIGEKKKAGLGPRSVQYIHAILRSALGTAMEDDAVKFNVAGRIKAPKLDKSEIEPLTPDQAIHFLEAVRGDRLEALYTVGTALGMRQGEQLGLRWKYVDLEAGTLRIEWGLQRIPAKLADGSTRMEIHLAPPKQHSRRTVDLPQIAIHALRAHRERQQEERLLCGAKWHTSIAVECDGETIAVDDLVFVTPIGSALDPCNLNKRFQAILKNCGIPRHRFHDLRHTAATLLTLQKVPAKAIMKILGWSQMSMLDRYSHVVEEMRRDAAQKMDEILTRKAAPEVAPDPQTVSKVVSRGRLYRVK